MATSDKNPNEEIEVITTAARSDWLVIITMLESCLEDLEMSEEERESVNNYLNALQATKVI